MTAEEQLLAVTRWWPQPTFDPSGRVFVASVGGFVVYVGEITRVRSERGQVAYEVDTSDTELRDRLRWKRILTPLDLSCSRSTAVRASSRVDIRGHQVRA